MYIRVFSVRALQYWKPAFHHIRCRSSASPLTKTKRRRPATTLPAVPNDNNDNNNGILSSGQTVVAWTHVIVNPPIAIKQKCTGVCRSAGEQKQAKVIL
jgi:hypothetical protein